MASLKTSDFESKVFLKTVTTRPGVYQMFNARHELIYVGKARNLKNRLSSYFRTKNLSPKTAAMVQKIAAIEVIVTSSEDEALLLEYNLIKEHKPKYNILFRDDKSYPYIVLSHDEFPRIYRQRGHRLSKGDLFGPYVSTTAVRETLDLLVRIFKLRTCKNSFFRSRSRPCLQYQINRCSAPCVKAISQEDYQKRINDAKLFLEGKSDLLIQRLTKRMEMAAEEKAFEIAAKLRDQIRVLRDIQSSQSVTANKGDLDLWVVLQNSDELFFHLLIVREGRMISSKQFFYECANEMFDDAISQFLLHYYLTLTDYLPHEILINQTLNDELLLRKILSNKAGRKVDLREPKRGEQLKRMRMAIESAETIFESERVRTGAFEKQYTALEKVLQIDRPIQRMECFDISHTMGEATVGSCVVFNRAGADSQSYRRYNITDVTPGDDFAAMRQVLIRRYSKKAIDATDWPDLIIVDGGKGQLHEALKLFETIQKPITLLGVAKGVERKPGMETLFLNGSKEPIHLPEDSDALHLIQQIRDEAHRFAITGHRKKRGKKIQTSPLENIEGIGTKKRTALLKYFGGWQGVSKASVEELMKVEGISERLAKIIFDSLH